MGTKVLRALTSTLLIAGVFSAPLSVSYADESASTTPEVTVDVPLDLEIESPVEPVATTSEAIPVPDEVPATTTPDTIVIASGESVVLATQEEPAPLPTGVLFDNSLADAAWGVGVYYPPGNYAYFPGGYTALGNPPTVAAEGFWTTTGTTTYARVKRAGADTTCGGLSWGGTYGLSVFLPDFSSSFDTNPYATRTVGEYCDFVFYGGGIAPGTALGSVFLGANYMSVAGSSNNPGTSLSGAYGDPVPGGFAFQLCGADGCSGGFATSTATTTPDVATTTPQVSNVLFLPGIKGSRLYKNENVCGEDPGPCELTLWEPYGDGLAQRLLLDSDGKSTEDVYVKEGSVIDEVGGQKFYASFIGDLKTKDEMDEYGINWKWRAVAYDWRLSLPDIINNGAKYGDRIYYDQATSTPYIEQTLRELAGASPTGKVTIIAHSNGGLVTKALLLKLGDAETAELVDKIIFVGVPQSGAPQALGALLFGDKEALPGKPYLPDVLISKQLSRKLAENSPMAYHLMPSASYFEDVQDPNHSVMGFSGTHLYQAEQTAYGPSIDTVTERDDFLLAREGGREKPEPEDVAAANILNANLITYANDIHTSLDAWIPPSGVTLCQVAGWGVDTISGIDFYDEQKMLGATIGYKRQYRPVFIQNGDKVVPVPSALMTTASSNVHNYWLNLVETKNNHGDLFELVDLRQFILGRLNNIEELPQSISTTTPIAELGSKRFTFQLHSPLTLGMYDSGGNYTGLNNDGSVSEEVPGTTYGEFGEVKYLIAPAGNEYELVLNGQSDGVFSLDIQEQQGDFSTTTTFADIPTTASTAVRLTITNGIADASLLSIDTNGDSETDIEIAPVPGEIVQYVPLTSTTEETEEQNSGSGSIKRSTQATVAVIGPLSAISAPTTLAAVPNTPNPRVLGADTTEVEASQAESSISDQTPSLKQTASVYNALSLVTEWFRTLMYNIWKGLLTLLST